MKEKLQEIPKPQRVRKLAEMKAVIAYHEERKERLQRSVWYTYYLSPALALLNDAVVFLC